MINLVLKMFTFMVFIMASLHAMHSEIEPAHAHYAPNFVQRKIEQTKRDILEVLAQVIVLMRLIKEHPVQTTLLVSVTVLWFAILCHSNKSNPPSCLDCLEMANFFSHELSSCDFICKPPFKSSKGTS